jgi:hypothetical protein
LHKRFTGNGCLQQLITGGSVYAAGIQELSLMYNDPNQPPYGEQPQQPEELPPTQYAPQPTYEQQPPPYGQPQQPPANQPPPYGQPLYAGVPPVPAAPPAYTPPPQQKKSLKWLWITLSIVAAVFVFSCAICGSIGLFASVPGSNRAAQDYYNAVKNQDYATAYTYLAPGAAFVDPQSNQTVQIPSQFVYTTVAQALDKNLGVLTNYQVSSGSDSSHVNVAVTRVKTQYDITLTMTQVDGKWKILNANGI